MRSPLCLLFSLASLSAAMPLHKGASWTWRVVDLKTNQITYRSAVVTDSSFLDDLLASGTLWTLALRDSMTGDADTALLLANGASQIWHQGSRLLPIEPKPWNGNDASWGRTALASTRDQEWVEQYSISPAGGAYPSISGSFATGIYKTTTTIDRPRGIWSDSLGVERFQVLRKEWTLVRADGRNKLLPPASLMIPDSGSTFEWQRFEHSLAFSSTTPTTRASTRILWRIASRAADSAGWKLVDILETRSGGGSSTTTPVHIAFNPTTGERLPARNDSVFLPDDAWRVDWKDSVHNGIRLRRTQTSSSTSGTVGPSSSASTFSQIVVNRLDSTYASWTSSSRISPSTFSATSHVLLSSDGKSFRDAVPESPAGVSPRRIATDRNLSDIASAHPDATVRWSDVQGRSGTAPLGQFLSSRPSGGVLHLSIPLPDGSTWQGTSIGLAHP